jgi:RimJ/RimL family protein N-acetyltransferase
VNVAKAESGEPMHLKMLRQRLVLADVPPESLAAEVNRVSQLGIRITTLAKEVTFDPNAPRRAYDLHNECRRRQPPMHTRAQDIPFARWSETYLDEHGTEALQEGFFLARSDNTYVGLCALLRTSHLHVLDCGFTGVAESHGGRGIARALKAAAIGYALTRECTELTTSVLAENPAMLRINERLGFRTEEVILKEYADPPPG